MAVPIHVNFRIENSRQTRSYHHPTDSRRKGPYADQRDLVQKIRAKDLAMRLHIMDLYRVAYFGRQAGSAYTKVLLTLLAVGVLGGTAWYLNSGSNDSDGHDKYNKDKSKHPSTKPPIYKGETPKTGTVEDHTLPQDQALTSATIDSAPDLEQIITDVPTIDFPLSDALKPYQEQIYKIFEKLPRHSNVLKEAGLDYWDKLASIFEQAQNANLLGKILDMFLQYKPAPGSKAFEAEQYQTLARALITALGDDYYGGGQSDMFRTSDGKIALVRLTDEEQVITVDGKEFRFPTQEDRRAMNRSAMLENISALFKNIDAFSWARTEYDINTYDYLKTQLGQRGEDQRGNAKDGVANFGAIRSLRTVQEASPLPTDPEESLFDTIKKKSFEGAITYLYKWSSANFNDGNNVLGIADQAHFLLHVYRAFGFNASMLEAELVRGDVPTFKCLAIKKPGYQGFYLFWPDAEAANLPEDQLERMLTIDGTTILMQQLQLFGPRIIARYGGHLDFRPLGEDKNPIPGADYRNALPTQDITEQLIPTAMKYNVQLINNGTPLEAGGADLNLFVYDPSRTGAFDGALPDRISELDYLRHLVPILGVKIGENGKNEFSLNSRTDADGQNVFRYVVAAVTNDGWPLVNEALKYLAQLRANPDMRDTDGSTQRAIGILKQYFNVIQPNVSARIEVRVR